MEIHRKLLTLESQGVTVGTIIVIGNKKKKKHFLWHPVHRLHDMFVFKHTTWIPVGLVYQLPALRLSGFNAILVGQIPCCQTKSWLFGWLNPSCSWFSDVFVVQNLVLLGQIPSACWFWTNLFPDIWHIPTMSPSISPLYPAAHLLVLHLRNAVDLATALSWALCSSWVSWVPRKLWGVPQMTSETGEKNHSSGGKISLFVG